MDDTQLLTVSEVADRPQVRPEAVRRWIGEGHLRAIMPGGVKTGCRIRDGEVERFFKQAEKAS